jgi:hypothetical protein
MLYNQKNRILVKEEGVYIIVNGMGGTINHKQLL